MSLITDAIWGDMITAKAQRTQPLRREWQFVASIGSEHQFLPDDAAGGMGPKPIELVAAALARSTAFEVVTVLRQKYNQRVKKYEVRGAAEQAERTPQVFTTVWICYVITGFEIDSAAIEQAILLSEEEYCSAGAMVKQTATLKPVYEIVEEETARSRPTAA